LNKHIKCNFGGQRCGTSTIVDIRRLKFKVDGRWHERWPLLWSLRICVCNRVSVTAYCTVRLKITFCSVVVGT